MKGIQYDSQIRVVALSNLIAMCKRVSSSCHRFEIYKVTRNRVQIVYSNPDEYGTEFPMIAEFATYLADSGNPYVVLDIVRVLHDNWDGEGWQAFQPLLDCPVLWRSAPNAEEWQTEEEIRKTCPIVKVSQ